MLLIAFVMAVAMKESGVVGMRCRSKNGRKQSRERDVEEKKVKRWEDLEGSRMLSEDLK